MKWILEKLFWVGLYFLLIVIGAGIAALVIQAIEQTKVEACFTYKNPEVCEEVIEKARAD